MDAKGDVPHDELLQRQAESRQTLGLRDEVVLQALRAEPVALLKDDRTDGVLLSRSCSAAHADIKVITRHGRVSKRLYAAGTVPVNCRRFDTWLSSLQSLGRALSALTITRRVYDNSAREPTARLVPRRREDLPVAEQLMTKLTFDMELGNSTISMFRLAESQLKQQGKLAKPVDYGAFVYPDLLRKVMPGNVNYKP